jgi:hypothetical protein
LVNIQQNRLQTDGPPMAFIQIPWGLCDGAATAVDFGGCLALASLNNPSPPEQAEEG